MTSLWMLRSPDERSARRICQEAQNRNRWSEKSLRRWTDVVVARAATHASKFQADGIPVESPAPPTRTHLLRTPQPQVSAWSEFHLSLLPPSPPAPPPHAAVCGRRYKDDSPGGFPPARLLSPVLALAQQHHSTGSCVRHCTPPPGRVFHPPPLRACHLPAHAHQAYLRTLTHG